MLSLRFNILSVILAFRFREWAFWADNYGIGLNYHPTHDVIALAVASLFTQTLPRQWRVPRELRLLLLFSRLPRLGRTRLCRNVEWLRIVICIIVSLMHVRACDSYRKSRCTSLGRKLLTMSTWDNSVVFKHHRDKTLTLRLYIWLLLSFLFS